MAANGEQTRDVKNHYLFEVATEVAHRGPSPSTSPLRPNPPSPLRPPTSD